MKNENTITVTPVKIKAEWKYYYNTFNAPEDGYLHPEWMEAPMEFASVRNAYDFLTDTDADIYDAEWTGLVYEGDGEFRARGVYVTSHGQHSRPVFTVVSAKSGRCTKAIIAECDAIYDEQNK